MKVHNLPRDIATLEVADIFSKEGSLFRIELPNNPDGSSKGIAFVVFSPPPKRDFWSRDRYEARIEERNVKLRLRITLCELAEPTFYKGLNTGKQYPETMTLSADSLEFGILYDEQTMKSMYSTQALPKIPVTVRQSLKYREIEVVFPVQFRGGDHTNLSKGLK